jgi:hypothetical protein
MSLVNKWFLHQSTPKLSQVLFWDRRIVPLSRIADPIFFHAFGKSLIAICRTPLVHRNGAAHATLHRRCARGIVAVGLPHCAS